MAADLARFLPRSFFALLDPQPSGPLLPTAACARNLRVASLFVDVVGFTALMETLTSLGAGGSEVLKDMLDAYFSRLVATVRRFGGDVLFFAGDALLAIWPIDPDIGIAEGNAIGLAVSCAVAIRDGALDDVDGLRVRTGIGLGPASLQLLGGVSGGWMLVADGSGITDAMAAEALAQPGQVVAAAAVAEHVAVIAFPEGGGLLAPNQESLAEPDNADAQHLESVHGRLVAAVDGRVDGWPAIQGMLPHPLKRDPQGEALDAQLRAITTVFVRLHCAADADSRHRAVVILQQHVDKFGGALNKLMRDDKGVVALVVFGLPGLDNSPERAVVMAVRLVAALSPPATAQPPGIGVASGQAYCGQFGSAIRSEYAVLGDVVNVAARFMQHARGDVRIDNETRSLIEASSDKVACEELPAIRVKGKHAELRNFRAVAQTAGPLDSARVDSSTAYTIDSVRSGSVRSGSEHLSVLSRVRDLPLIGRKGQTKRIAAFLEVLPTSRPTSPLSSDSVAEIERRVLVVSGPPGIGKSKILREVASLRGDLRILPVECEYEDRSSPMAMWRGIVQRAVLALTASRMQLSLNALKPVLGLLTAIGHEKRDAALLKTILPELEVPAGDLEWAAGLPSESRSNKTAELVADILRRTTHRWHTVVTVDSVHHADSASLQLAAQVIESVPSLVWIVSARDSAREMLATELWDKLALPIEEIAVGVLDKGSVVELLEAYFDVNEVMPDVANVVVTRADGNPNSAIVMAQSLVESRSLVIAGGVCSLASHCSGEQLLEKTFSIKSAALERLDALPARQQTLLRYASVAGSTFESKDVEYLCTRTNERIDVRGDLNRLFLADFVRISRDSFGSTNLVCTFSQETMREAAYETLLVSKRRRLHSILGDKLARSRKETGVQVSNASIARHYVACEDEALAVRYTYAAATDARESRAFREAIYWFDKLEIILDAGDARASSDTLQRGLFLRRASSKHSVASAAEATGREERRLHRLRVYAHRGSCYHDLGEYLRANQDFEVVLDLVHAKRPAGKLSRAWEAGLMLLFGSRVTKGWLKGTMPDTPVVGKTARIRRFARWILDECDPDDRSEVSLLLYKSMVGITDSTLVEPDNVRDLVFLLRGLVLIPYEQLPDARVHAFLAIFYGVVLSSDPRLYDMLAERVKAHCARVDAGVRAEALTLLTWVYLVNARWTEGLEAVTAAEASALELNASGALRDLYGGMSVTLLFIGRIRDAFEAGSKAYHQWKVTRDPVARVWGLLSMLKAAVDLGDKVAARAHTSELMDLLQAERGADALSKNPLNRSETLCVVAVAKDLLGEESVSFSLAREALDSIESHDAGNINLTWAYWNLTTLLRRHYDGGGRYAADAARLFPRMLKQFRRFQKIARAGRPALLAAEALLRKGAPRGKGLAKAIAAAEDIELWPLVGEATMYAARVSQDPERMATARALLERHEMRPAAARCVL